MSPAYLIEVADTKQGVCYPTVVGPFVDPAAAAAFAEELRMGDDAMDQGGYSCAHVISDEGCDFSPESYREAYAWRLEELA